MVGLIDFQVHKALKDESMLDNTIIIFTSDNGGIPSKHISNNYPLRGQKTMLFEGIVYPFFFKFSKHADTLDFTKFCV